MSLNFLKNTRRILVSLMMLSGLSAQAQEFANNGNAVGWDQKTSITLLDGRVEVWWLEGGQPRRFWQWSPNSNSWSGTVAWWGDFLYNLTLVRRKDGLLEIAGLGSDRALYVRTQQRVGSWGPYIKAITPLPSSTGDAWMGLKVVKDESAAQGYRYKVTSRNGTYALTGLGPEIAYSNGVALSIFRGGYRFTEVIKGEGTEWSVEGLPELKNMALFSGPRTRLSIRNKYGGQEDFTLINSTNSTYGRLYHSRENFPGAGLFSPVPHDDREFYQFGVIKGVDGLLRIRAGGLDGKCYFKREIPSLDASGIYGATRWGGWESTPLPCAGPYSITCDSYGNNCKTD